MTTIIDGKALAKELEEDLKAKFSSLGRQVRICEFNTTESEDSISYGKARQGLAKRLGITIDGVTVRSGSTQAEVEAELARVCSSGYDSIFVSMPVAGGLNPSRLQAMLPANQDMDGLSPINLGNLMLKDDSVFPATAKSIAYIIDRQDLPKGAEVCIINRSVIIGRPLAMALLNRDYSVTVCHSKTDRLQEKARRAKVVVTATGKAGFLTADYVTRDSIVIDASVNSVDGKLVGDSSLTLNGFVDRITPVPGGVGPVTNVMAFYNVYNGIRRSMA